MSGVSVTAYWMAAERARETVRPDRLFEDPLAARSAGPEGVELMEAMEEGFGPNPAFAAEPVKGIETTGWSLALYEGFS